MATSNSPAEQLITENIDIWTSAIKKRGSQGRGSSKKIELYGIKKLRELILELAVRGLLVPQDPNDEPASVLLEKIAAEKEQLIKKGNTKKQKPIVENTKDKSLLLPLGWESTLFGSIALIERGGSPRPIKSFLTESPDGLNWIKIGDTEQGGKYITSTNERIVKEGLNKTRMVYPGDFLLTNSMSFGRPYISKITGCIHDGWLRISPPPSIDKDYLYILLSSPFIIKAFKKAAAGAVVLNLNADKVREVEVLIPPQAEQPRIVAKVDELMALCDQLEQQTESSLLAHQTLVETLLNTLLNADQNSFDPAWERIAQHFDVLFTTEHSIDQLKQTILQLAVMGKLVPQDPNDEPASVLLEKIAAEKEQLIKDKKIKLQKKAQVFEQSIKYESLPKGWEAVDFGDITFNRDAERIPLSVSDRNMRKGEYDYYGASGVIDNIDNYLFDKPLLLIGEDGANLVNRSTPIAFMAYGKYWVNNHAHVLDGITEQFLIYISLYINSISLLPYITGMAQPKMNQAKMNSILVLLPPENEQIRIITKVNELVTLCESMKTQIRETQTTQLHLADAMAEQALNS